MYCRTKLIIHSLYGIKNRCRQRVKNGQKELVIWYKDGLKSSVKKKLTADFVKLMKQNGANVSVKSWNFTDDYVLITLA